MGFTTQVFLFVFFPVCLLSYIIVDKISGLKIIKGFLDKLRVRDILLIIFSLGFYMWTCFDNIFRLLFYILAVYLSALIISYIKEKGYSVNLIRQSDDNGGTVKKRVFLCIIPFVTAVILITGVLVYCNYSNFLIDCWNGLFGDSVPYKSIIAPLGISFITFSAISYLTDIYRWDASTGSFIDCLLYLSFFPKIISGPIVLWKDFQGQIKTRVVSLDDAVDGLNRIMIGFGKKIILADSFGACLSKIPLSGIDRITAAGTLILYMLQIYYDFAGYSDIAIGISKLFGFDFKENFNFPYRSKSITEFWRRWHISLGSWFREYIYFPLGGSRKGQGTTLRKLAVIFALTGIWHGAGWNYIIWGMINGIFAVVERVAQKKKYYVKTPSTVKYIFTMLVVMLFWQLFRYEKLEDISTLFGIIFGNITFENISFTWEYYYDLQIVVFVIIGIAGSTLLGSPKLIALKDKIIATKAGYLVQELLLLTVFVTAILFMVNSTYSPFIYFQY